MRGVEIPLITMNVKQSTFINLPAEEIFAYISNLENLVDWSSIVIALRKTSPGAVEVGTTFQGTIRFLTKWLSLTFEMVEYEPGRYLTLKSTSGASPCLVCYQFDPVEDGGANVSLEILIHHTEGIVELATPVIESAVRRQLEYDLLTLKDMLESRASMYQIAD